MKSFVIVVSVLSLIFNQAVFAASVSLPADKRVFIELLQEVRAADVQAGQTITARVLDDVLENGKTVIKRGTSVLVRVDTVKKRKVAGRQAELSLGAYETTAVDGQGVRLFGGYKKEGESRVALSISLGVLILLPLIFIRGKEAVLPAGSVIDAFTRGSHLVSIEDMQSSRKINLSRFSDSDPMSAILLYENLGEDSDTFDFKIESALGSKDGFSITSVNDESIKPLKLKVKAGDTQEKGAEIIGSVKIKKLVKIFRKGFNTIKVVNTSNPEDEFVEMMIDVEF